MSFRGTRVVHHQCDPCVSEPIPMRKPPTGEPCAGEPHARFGGRGRREPFPTPIRWETADLFRELWFQDTSFDAASKRAGYAIHASDRDPDRGFLAVGATLPAHF